MLNKQKRNTLLWEALRSRLDVPNAEPMTPSGSTLRTPRLPCDKQCAAATRSGKRCRGRVREGSEFCPFHDPSLSEERRRHIAAMGGRSHHRLSHLPDGYLRKLTNRRAVAEAMDRLYREVRNGVISPEMGTVLFNVLTRMLDKGLCDAKPNGGGASRRSKIDRIRPELGDLLTRADTSAWREAVAASRENPPAAATEPRKSRDFQLAS